MRKLSKRHHEEKKRREQDLAVEVCDALQVLIYVVEKWRDRNIE